MSEVTIQGHKVASCTRAYFTLPVCRMASGLQMEIPVHVINGAKPGPTLMLTALSHGDAPTGLEVIRQVLETVDMDQLSGTIVAVPCQNPVAFEWNRRNTPLDSYNMNRTYPGNLKGWFTEQLAATISPLCDEADYLIDWHGGEFGCAINYVLLKLNGGDYVDEGVEMGKAYGLEYMYGGKPAGALSSYAGSLTDYMLSLGKPAIIAEVGHGMHLTFDQNALSVQGVFNVLKYIGAYPGQPILPKKQYFLQDRPLLRPRNGGMFYPECGPELLNKVVPKGTLMATIRNPLSLEVIEQMYAPCEETVFLMMRGMMSAVNPGGYAYILGECKTAKVFENE